MVKVCFVAAHFAKQAKTNKFLLRKTNIYLCNSQEIANFAPSFDEIINY